MKTFSIAVSALATVLASSGAVSAQPVDPDYVAGYEGVYTDDAPYRGYAAWRSIDDRPDDLDDRINAGRLDGSLSPGQADMLRAEHRAVATIASDYRDTDDSISAWERGDLDRRLDDLSARIAAERDMW